MKKSIKILSLVLALAIICGALVIGVFAKTASEFNGVNGVTVVEATDLEDLDPNLVVKGTDSETTGSTYLPAGTSASAVIEAGKIAANIKGCHGILNVVSSEYEANKYITFTPGAVQSTSNPYLSSGYATAPQMKDKTSVITQRYQVMDFDISFPAGRATNYICPNFQLRYINAEGKNTTAGKGSIGFIIWSNDTADSKIYIQDNTLESQNTDKACGTLSATEWNHITFVVEMTDAWATADGTACEEGAEGAIAVLDYTGYIIVNNQILSKVYYGNSINFINMKDASAFQSKDLRDIVFVEWRTNFTNNNAESEYNKNAIIALDNLSWRSINPTDYAKANELKVALATGVTGSLATWTDSLYDANDMPFGTLAATIGEGEEIQYFDSLQKAITAAQAGQTVTLRANSNELISVNKAITVLKNGFTANFVNDNVKLTETGDAYVFEATSVKMTVRVNACTCGNNCITAKSITVSEGANIWDAIVNAYGAEPTCSYTVGDTKYEFDGFTVTGTAASFFEGGKFNKSAVVTAEMANKVALLTVAYKELAPIARIYKNDGTVRSIHYTGETISGIVAKAKAGDTVKFLADVEQETGYATISLSGITVDINGYTMKYVKYSSGKSGGGLFRLKGAATFTVTSSVVGGKVYCATDPANDIKAADPFITFSADGCTLNFIGQVDGTTTLSIYGANAVQSYGNQSKINVDGGYYCRNRGDNYALFDLRVLSDCTFQNATMDGDGRDIFAFCGRDAGMGTTTAKITIDNCYLINGNVLRNASDKTTVTFTNCVIGGSMPADVESSATALTGDEIYIGKGCKIASGVTFNEKINFTSEPVAISETLTYTVYKNDWALEVEDKFAINEKTVEVNVDKMVAETIEVEFVKDGASYGKQTVVPGMSATVLMGEVPGTEGLVNQSAVVPVPADAKAGDKIAIPADAEMAYSAGKVPVHFSLSMTTHFAANYFVPVVEGIEYVTIQHALGGYSARPATLGTTGVKEAVDGDGNNWICVQGWPGARNLDETAPIVVTYKYMDTTLTYTTKNFSVADYASYIIANKGDKLATVVADMVAYIYEFNMAKSGAVSDVLKAVYDDEATKAAMTETAIPADATNAAAKAQMAKDGYITEIAVIAKSEGGTIGIKLNGNYGFKIYKDDPNNEGNQPNWEQNQWRIDGTGYMYVHNLRSYALNDTFIIEVYESYTGTGAVTFGGELLATYEWSLAGYINDNEQTNNPLAVALYNYACSADEYIQWKKDNNLNNFT